MNDLYFMAKYQKGDGKARSRELFLPRSSRASTERPICNSTFLLAKCARKSASRFAWRATIILTYPQISRAASHPILECKHSRDRLNSSSRGKHKRECNLHSLVYSKDGKVRKRTKFAEEFPCEPGTSFRQICAPDPRMQAFE